jgi:hypothetical protein
MQWRTVIVLATTGALINAARSFREPVMVPITWDRRPKIDRISLFRRILTVTRLMTLAGNKPGEPRRMKCGLG